MLRRNVRAVIVGASVFIVALTSSFLLGQAADAIRPMPIARTAFSIISFPIFTLSSAHLGTVYFWQLAFLNCTFWAALAVLLMRLWKSN